MKIAATTVRMDAARTYREVEQRKFGWSPLAGAGFRAGQGDDFGTRLSRLLSSSTEIGSAGQSVIRPATGGDGLQLLAGGTKWSDTGTAVTELAGNVIGRPVTLRSLQEALPSFSPFESFDPLSRPSLQVGMAQLVSSDVYSEEERVMFSAQGKVQTTDGREIAFNLGLAMERDSTAVASTAMGLFPVLVDPLILNFGNSSPLLTDSSFLFDLDADGNRESVSCPAQGCGFLAFDRNHDGSINDGSELFGPTSGSGFGELAKLDSDANGWIDENDPLFDRLQVWSRDAQGNSNLLSLREAGVGALSIRHAGTDFQLAGPEGEVLGNVKQSGIFLSENGEVHSLQEIDLAKGTSAFPSLADRDPVGGAIESMRAIIAMQQLRLKMMLTARHLSHAMAEKTTGKDWLFRRNQSLRQAQAASKRPSERAGEVAAADGKTVSASSQDDLFRMKNAWPDLFRILGDDNNRG